MLSTVLKLSSARRDELLRTVSDRCEPLEVLVSEDSRIVRHASRFLRVLVSDGGLQLIVELPTRAGKAGKFHRGQELEAMFHVGGERFAFTTRVLGRCMQSLNDEQKVSALVLAYPLGLQNRQRRAHYRVPLGMANPISVAFMEIPLSSPTLQIPSLHSGFISDISAGGTAVLCLQRLPVSIGIGSRLIVSFQLPDEPEHLDLEGTVRNVRQTDVPGSRILGIEYLRERGDIRSRRHIDLIQRFVVKRQREILKKLRML